MNIHFLHITQATEHKYKQKTVNVPILNNLSFEEENNVKKAFFQNSLLTNHHKALYLGYKSNIRRISNYLSHIWEMTSFCIRKLHCPDIYLLYYYYYYYII